MSKLPSPNSWGSDVVIVSPCACPDLDGIEALKLEELLVF